MALSESSNSQHSCIVYHFNTNCKCLNRIAKVAGHKQYEDHLVGTNCCIQLGEEAFINLKTRTYTCRKMLEGRRGK